MTKKIITAGLLTIGFAVAASIATQERTPYLPATETHEDTLQRIGIHNHHTRLWDKVSITGSGFEIEGKPASKDLLTLQKIVRRIEQEGDKFSSDSISKEELILAYKGYQEILDVRPEGMGLIEASKEIRIEMRESGFFGPGSQAIINEKNFKKLFNKAGLADSPIKDANLLAPKVEPK